MERTADRCTLHFEDDFHTFTPSDARSRSPSLILFSLGPAKSHSHMNDPLFAIDRIEALLDTDSSDDVACASSYGALMALLTELESHLQESGLPQKSYTSQRISRLRRYAGAILGFDSPQGEDHQRALEAISQVRTGFQMSEQQ